MSLHGWVTAVLAVGVLGLGVMVATQPSVTESGTGAEAAGGALEARLDRFESQLDDVRRNVRRNVRERPRAGHQLTPPPIAGTTVAEARAAAAAATGDGTAGAARLEARVAALEKRVASLATQPGGTVADPSTLSTEELQQRAAQMTAANRRGARGVAGYKTEEGYWRELLERELTEDERHQAQYGLGIVLRGQKRHAEEAAVFEGMIHRAGGMDTEKGVSAGFQLAWARAYSNDPAEAANVFDRVVNSRSVSPILRVHSLLRAGEYAMRAHDDTRARDYLQRLVTDYREDVPESQAWILKNAERHIQKLDGN